MSVCTGDGIRATARGGAHPLHDGALNLEEREADARLCAWEGGTVSTRTRASQRDSSGEHARQFWGDLRMRLLRVSRILVLLPA